MTFPAILNPTAGRARERDRWNPDRETLELAASGAAWALGHGHRVTKALAKAAITMDKIDLGRAKLELKTLRRDQRRAIAEAVEAAWEAEGA